MEYRHGQRVTPALLPLQGRENGENPRSHQPPVLGMLQMLPDPWWSHVRRESFPRAATPRRGHHRSRTACPPSALEGKVSFHQPLAARAPSDRTKQFRRECRMTDAPDPRGDLHCTLTVQEMQDHGGKRMRYALERCVAMLMLYAA